MKWRSQKQVAGDESTLVQAYGSVTLNMGVTSDEVRRISLEVFRANFIEMQGVAQQVVQERVEDFTDNFLRELGQESQEALNAIQDPDVQFGLHTAQKEFARSGSPDLGEALVDLVVKRCATATGSLKAIVLNEAIDAIGRLTQSQINALSLNFVVARTLNNDVSSRAELAAWVRNTLMPLSENVARHVVEYEHLASVRCASISMGSHDLGDLIKRHYPGLFAEGWPPGSIPEEYNEIEDFLRPCLTNPDFIQVNAMNETVVERALSNLGRLDLLEGGKRLLYDKLLADEKVVAMVAEDVPEFESLAEIWKSTPIKSLDLTSVGTAIAHANYRRRSGDNADLSIWIPDDL